MNRPILVSAQKQSPIHMIDLFEAYRTLFSKEEVEFTKNIA